MNGDGRVSVEELAARTDKSMKAFYKDEANTRLKSLDTNNDGKVSWDEYTESAEKKGGNLFVERFCDFTGQRYSKGGGGGGGALLCTAFSETSNRNKQTENGCCTFYARPKNQTCLATCQVVAGC